jgi:LPS-assembly lipoprotein
MKAEGGRRKDGTGCPNAGAFASSFILLSAALLLASCGFHLRGQTALPFESLYVQAPPTSQLVTQLKRTFAAGSGVRIADKPGDAQVLLQIMNELREKEIVALSGGGRVREYQLRYRVSYRLTDNKGVNVYIAPSELVLRREFSFNDAEALAKESEEALLYRDMQSDAVQQLMRRLQAAKIGQKE